MYHACESRNAKYEPMEWCTDSFVAALDTKYKFEETIALINLRIQVTLAFPPEHDQFTTEEDTIETVRLPLCDLFEEPQHDAAKRFLYYLASSTDLAYYLRHDYGISIIGPALGNRSAISIDRENIKMLSCYAQNIIDAWRQFKLLTSIIRSF